MCNYKQTPSQFGGSAMWLRCDAMCSVVVVDVDVVAVVVIVVSGFWIICKHTNTQIFAPNVAW